ncbi:MAG: FkbM family methyltransferase [Saprospiraceae bacterium]|nr:FkbM family methyltransferase [Saprospiraceae bacterium]
MVKKIFNLIAGKKKFQNFFHLLLRLAIYGLNIGGGSHSRNSGEINALKYIKAKLLKNEEIIVFDVGANIGEYSVLCFESFKEKSKIFSFEPSHSAFLKFKENTKYIKSIFAINQGLGETGGKMTLYSNKKSSGLASVYKRNLIHFGINMDQMEEISITTIDKVSEENKITSIDFLKLDVEGHEISVLKGATKMISEKELNLYNLSLEVAI